MFSNRQQQNSSNLLHQIISSTSSIVLPPPPPAISINSVSANCNNNTIVTSVATTILALDNLNCGGIPTRTTPTLTPTTLRTIAADIVGLPGPSEDFAVAAASNLHHLVSSSCPIIVPSSVTADRLTSDLQDRQNLQNLGNQQLNLQNLNNQLVLNNLQTHQQLNEDSLNQQQNDYNYSFSLPTSRQAGFVPPLVLQINSSNANVQPPSSLTVLLNSNNNSSSNYIFSTKSTPNVASSSHWQGAVVTHKPQKQSRSASKQQFSDDEDEFDSIDSDSSETGSVKVARKQNTKTNKSNSKTNTKTTSSGRQSKNNKVMSVEEEERRQIRRQRNKLAAARCRKRRMDHTNELLEETEQLEDKRLRLQVEIQSLRQQKTDLQQMLAQHKCVVNINNIPVSNALSTVNNALLDSNDVSKHDTTILSNHMSISKGNSLQQNISSNIKTDIYNVDDTIIKIEDQIVIDNKDDIDLIPTTVLQQSHRRRPTTLLQLNNSNFGNSKKIPGNGSNGVVVLNFDSLMDGGTGLTPVSGNIQIHNQQIQHDSLGGTK